MDIMSLRSVGIRAKLDGKAIEDLKAVDLINFLTFDSKDSYFEWVANWKEEYQALSELIREKKSASKELARAGNPDAGFEQSRAVQLGRDARLMLAVRKAGKEYSWSLKQLVNHPREEDRPSAIDTAIGMDIATGYLGLFKS